MDERVRGRLRTAVAAIRRSRRHHDWARQVCAACRDAVPGIDSAALVLYDANRSMDLLGVSDAFAELIEDTQVVVGEGPGWTAFSTGATAMVEDLEAEGERWPVFVPEAARLGIGAMFVFPLQVGGIRLGVLDLYRRRPGALSTRSTTDAALLAALISYALIEEAAAVNDGAVTGLDIPPLATTRRDINVATGMIAAQMGIAIDEAFVRLRAFAFAAERPLLDVARDVLERRVNLDGAAE
ncbi:GAF and ANTAR domain-containing protein [Nocardia jiangxiensis]|uniref:GAF and ANTAR domain-containing protein n=1 Tax=Nocardia jiangxiensis TaxID=282685 RepID=A0ABW6RUP7_9NOCA|nr:GAF and ANTAR domain-containing protein [Nocardia jiangxiensis]